ncbi:MAG: hypothetical protein J6Y53_05720 [Alphaproteobacteria bacterium]|nr:hypothetical protein [Alphaproteobacteria bacterium]
MEVKEVADIEALSFLEHADLFRQMREKLNKNPELASSLFPDFCRLLEGKGSRFDMIPDAADVFALMTKDLSKPQIKEMIAKIDEEEKGILIDRGAVFICAQNPKCSEIIFDRMVDKIKKIPYRDDLQGFYAPFIKNMTTAVIHATDDETSAMIKKTDNLEPELKGMFFAQLGKIYTEKPSMRDEVWDKIKKFTPKKTTDFCRLYQNIAIIANEDERKIPECLDIMCAYIRSIRQDASALTMAYEVLGSIREDYPDKNRIDDIIKQGMRNRANNSASKRIACRKMGRSDEFASSSYVGQRVGKTESNPYGFVSVDEVDTDDNSILFLGGNGTISEQRANGYLSPLEALLRANGVNEDVALYVAVYDFGEMNNQGPSFDDKLARQKMMQDYHHDIKLDRQPNDDTLHPFYVDNLFKKMFLNRISDKDGKRLSVDEACRRIRKMTVLAHCHGAYTFLKLEEKMQEKMVELGYSAQEREKIQHELLCVAHSPYAPLGVSKSTMISFVSAKDKDIQHYNNFEKEIRVMSIKDEVMLSYFPEKQGEMFLTPTMGRVSQHNFLGYNLNHSGLSKEGQVILGMAGNAIVNGVKNSISGKSLPSVKDIVCGNNEKFREFFEVLKENGVKMWQKVRENALLRLKIDNNRSSQR